MQYHKAMQISLDLVINVLLNNSCASHHCIFLNYNLVNQDLYGGCDGSGFNGRLHSRIALMGNQPSYLPFALYVSEWMLKILGRCDCKGHGCKVNESVRLTIGEP